MQSSSQALYACRVPPMEKARTAPLVLSFSAELLKGSGVGRLRESGGKQSPSCKSLQGRARMGGKQVLLSPTHLMCWRPWFPDSAVARHIAPSIPKEFS